MPLPPSSLIVSRETQERLERFVILLKSSSQNLNLVSRETLPLLWQRHIWDSYQISLLLPHRDCSILDLGSGAGFPGLVLAIAGYESVTLVEKSVKKGAFLQRASQVLGLKVRLENRPIEELEVRSYDCIVSRACAPLEKLLAFSLPFTGPSSRCIFLKGESWESEIERARETFVFEWEAVPSLTHVPARILVIKEVKRI